jgi:uroporphyrinogen-III synthase
VPAEHPSFNGLRVLVLESRHARELASIVTSYGGEPIVAPSMREVPLESNTEALTFAAALERGEYDAVVLQTGVGARALVEVVDRAGGGREPFLQALRRTRVIARGPKPRAVMRELQVPVWFTAPEPNTWRELLAGLDERSAEQPLAGLRIAVQEYGASNPDLVSGLAARGARVTSVPVYQWALPEDLDPLRAAVRALAGREIDVVLFTSATQLRHLLQVADSLSLGAPVREGLASSVVASVGPTTSEELRQQGIRIDLEASHPKMGFLAREAAERAPDLLRSRRA